MLLQEKGRDDAWLSAVLYLVERMYDRLVLIKNKNTKTSLTSSNHYFSSSSF